MMQKYFIIMCVLIFSTASLHAQQNIRVATFNIKELSTTKLQQVDANGVGSDEQLCAAASVIQAVRPDILLINEIDHDYTGEEPNYKINAVRLLKNYFNQGEQAINFAYIYAAPCNTGIPAGVDLDGDGYHATNANIPSSEYAADCFGWGEYPGQYSMAVFSNFPIQEKDIRTFQKFLWKNLPNNHLPENYYSDAALATLRLSSKSHWDVPILINGHTLHFLVSHPTPPGFDGDDDHNGRRNFDEIQFWKLYLNNDPAIVDDHGNTGGYQQDEPFIIAGDLNTSPKNEAVYDATKAIDQLLQHPRVQNVTALQTSLGAVETTGRKDSQNSTALFSAKWDTQIDYVLPSQNLTAHSGGVYWPSSAQNPLGAKNAALASDHRSTWLDISFK